MKKYFLPAGAEDRIKWLKNFEEKLQFHAATLQIDADSLAFVANSVAYLSYVLDKTNAVIRNKSEWTTYKDLLLYGSSGEVVNGMPNLVAHSPTPPPPVTEPIFARIQKLVAVIKKHRLYTEAIGRDLGIIGSELNLNTDDAQPVLSAKITGGKVIVKWNKGKFTSIDVFVDRNDGNGFAFLSNDAQPPFDEKISLPIGSNPETWTYIAYYKQGDKRVGQASLPVSVLVTPQL
jgi:hypothetical protein